MLEIPLIIIEVVVIGFSMYHIKENKKLHKENDTLKKTLINNDVEILTEYLKDLSFILEFFHINLHNPEIKRLYGNNVFTKKFIEKETKIKNRLTAFTPLGYDVMKNLTEIQSRWEVIQNNDFIREYNSDYKEITCPDKDLINHIGTLRQQISNLQGNLYKCYGIPTIEI